MLDYSPSTERVSCIAARPPTRSRTGPMQHSTANTKSQFIIIIPGAVGGVPGGMLAKKGFSVTFIARGKTREVLLTSGLRVQSILGDFSIERPRVVEYIGALPNGAIASLHRDLTNSRKSELDWQVGRVLEKARSAGVHLPRLSKCYEELRSRFVDS